MPAGPPPGASPEELVRGFLEAAADPADAHALARSFLAPGVSWQDGAGITVYEPASLKVSLVKNAPGGPAVAVAVQRRLQVDADGGYRPAPGPVLLRYPVTAVGGHWRVRDAPPGILLTPRDVERSYGAVVLEDLTADRTLLVPDPVLLPVSRTAVPAATMRYLLRGPTRWLAPAATTALPAQVQLLGTATLDAGTATVDLSLPAAAVSSAAWAAYTQPGPRDDGRVARGAGRQAAPRRARGVRAPPAGPARRRAGPAELARCRRARRGCPVRSGGARDRRRGFWWRSPAPSGRPCPCRRPPTRPLGGRRASPS